MKLTNKQIIDAVPALNKLMNEKLQAKTAFTIAKNVQTLSKIVEKIENTKNEKINKWIEKDEKGNPIKDTNKNAYKLKKDNKLNEEIQTLFKEENEINIDKINLEELKDIKIEPNTLISINWMIQE